MAFAVSFRAACAAVLAALVSVAEAAEPKQLRVAGSHGKHAHHHKHHHKQQHTSEHPALAAKMTADEKFGAIQKELMEAWREKDHIEKLKHTIRVQKALITEQKAMVLSGDSEEADGEERRQFLEMLHMVKGSKALLRTVRKAAISKTEKAMEEVMNLDKDSDKEIADAAKKIDEGEAEIARAKAMEAKAMLNKQKAQKVLAAAVQEAKYFQKVLEKKEKKTENQEPQATKQASEQIVKAAEEEVSSASSAFSSADEKVEAEEKDQQSSSTQEASVDKQEQTEEADNKAKAAMKEQTEDDKKAKVVAAMKANAVAATEQSDEEDDKAKAVAAMKVGAEAKKLAAAAAAEQAKKLAMQHQEKASKVVEKQDKVDKGMMEEPDKEEVDAN